MAKQHHLQDGSNPVIGITLYGSAAKGYWRPGSDIDGALITRGRSIEELQAVEEVARTLWTLFTGERDVSHAPFDDDSKIVMAGKSNFLLTGLFVGDYRRLQQLQRDYIAKMKTKPNGERQWVRDQRYIAEQGIDIDKLFERWNFEWKKKYGEPNLTKDQRLLLQTVIAIRKIPPMLKEISIQ